MKLSIPIHLYCGQNGVSVSVYHVQLDPFPDSKTYLRTVTPVKTIAMIHNRNQPSLK
jgi:hypothetical protein